MPNIIDKFFISGNYQDYIDWIKTTSLELTNLNERNPNNANSIFDKDALINFSATKLLSYISRSEAIVKQEKQEEIIKKNIEKHGRITMNTTSTTESNKDLLNDELNNKIKNQETENKALVLGLTSSQENLNNERKQLEKNTLQNKNIIIASKADSEKKILDELNKRIEGLNIGNDFDVDKGAASDEAIAKFDKSNYLNYKYIKNGFPQDQDPQDIFPQIGPEIKKVLTDNMLQQYSYKVFSSKQTNGDLEQEFRGWVIPNQKSKITWNIDKSKFPSTPNNTYTDQIKRILESASIAQPTGSYKFFIEKLHGRYADKSGYKANPITNQTKLLSPINYSNRKVFAAFIKNYNDQYKANFGEYNFIGRAEQVPIYKSTTRSFTLEFTMIADHELAKMAATEEVLKDDSNSVLDKLLNMPQINHGMGMYQSADLRAIGIGASTTFYSPESIWQRLTFLAQCMYPYYRSDGKMKEQPMTRIRIGDFLDIYCYISDLNVQQSTFDGPIVDFNNSLIGEQPIAYDITLSGNIIHDFEPSSEYYGFYHRPEFDGDPLAKTFGLGISKNEDTLKKTLTKKSPLSIKDVANLKNIKLDDIDIEELNSNLTLIKENLSVFKKDGINLLDQVKKASLKNIFAALKAVNTQKDKIALLQQAYDQGINIKDTFTNEINKIDLGMSKTVGALSEVKTNLTEKILDINTKLKQNGINITNNESINEISNKINPIKVIPKTISDIIKNNT